MEHNQLFSHPECHRIIRQYAMMAAGVVIDVGHAFVKLEPGDATRYDLVVVYNQINSLIYVGCSNFATSHGNGIYGYALDSFTVPNYVAEKSGISAEGSTAVVADFINLLKEELLKIDTIN